MSPRPFYRTIRRNLRHPELGALTAEAELIYPVAGGTEIGEARITWRAIDWVPIIPMHTAWARVQIHAYCFEIGLLP